MTAIHARGVKRQDDVPILIDRDQCAASTELRDLIGRPNASSGRDPGPRHARHYRKFFGEGR